MAVLEGYCWKGNGDCFESYDRVIRTCGELFLPFWFNDINREESFCQPKTMTIGQVLQLLFLATVCFNAVLGLSNTNTVTIKNRLPHDVRYKVHMKWVKA